MIITTIITRHFTTTIVATTKANTVKTTTGPLNQLQNIMLIIKARGQVITTSQKVGE
jgi:hypothetical protein